MSARVTVVTAGHLSTCPRMLKAADALHEAGYDVRVVSTSQTAWAARADRDTAAARRWRWRVVPYSRRLAPARWLLSGARQRLARMASGWSADPSVGLAVRAVARVHAELVGAVLEEPCDFVYGGTIDGIAAAADAAARAGVPFGVDLEDFHLAQHDPGPDAYLDRLAGPVVRHATARAAFVTAGSAAIAAAYRAEAGIAAVPIHNVFPLPARAPERHRARPRLALYWFSQTIGPRRGLERVIRAAGRSGRPLGLHLRGRPVPGYLDHLRALAAAEAPQLAVDALDPAPPDAMVEECRRFDVGLAVEHGPNRNKLLSLSNKAGTYVLAALPVAMTETEGHREMADDLGPGALRFDPDDDRRLADHLSRLAGDPRAFAEAREASWEAARRRWHWEHPRERGALLAAVAAACGR